MTPNTLFYRVTHAKNTTLTGTICEMVSKIDRTKHVHFHKTVDFGKRAHWHCRDIQGSWNLLKTHFENTDFTQ